MSSVKLSTTFLLLILWAHTALADVCPFYLTASEGHFDRAGHLSGSSRYRYRKTQSPHPGGPNQKPEFSSLVAEWKISFYRNRCLCGFFRHQAGWQAGCDQPKALGRNWRVPCVRWTRRDGTFLSPIIKEAISLLFDVGEDGSLGERSALMQFAGSGPDPKRQTKPYAHSTYIDPENKFVYSCDLGSDSVWIFNFLIIYGALSPCDPPAAKVPPGSGPRHLAFSPDDKFIYVANEMSHSVSSFNRDPATGKLTPLETVNTLLPTTPDKDITTAEIFFHPSEMALRYQPRMRHASRSFPSMTRGS